MCVLVPFVNDDESFSGCRDRLRGAEGRNSSRVTWLRSRQGLSDSSASGCRSRSTWTYTCLRQACHPLFYLCVPSSARFSSSGSTLRLENNQTLQLKHGFESIEPLQLESDLMLQNSEGSETSLRVNGIHYDFSRSDNSLCASHLAASVLIKVTASRSRVSPDSLQASNEKTSFFDCKDNSSAFDIWTKEKENVFPYPPRLASRSWLQRPGLGGTGSGGSSGLRETPSIITNHETHHAKRKFANELYR